MPVVLGTYMIDAYCSLLYLLSEVVILQVQVLGSWSHLWDIVNLNSTFIVLKNCAMNLWFGIDKVDTLISCFL
jgi:hypothetical protein